MAGHAPQIVILTHEQDAFERLGYTLNELAAIWRAKGLQVSVHQGLGPPVPADLAFQHVDLTVVPAPYQALARQYSKVLNGRVIDSSKRRISAHLVRRGDDYDGPVIVKTNRNFGGTMEARRASEGSFGARTAHRLRSRLPWSWRSHLPVADYPVFDSPRQVPRAVWYNPDLVVERFFTERHDGFYCLRTWTFLGDRETTLLAYSPVRIVKSRNIVRREPVAEVPAELRQMRRELGFDFGKFDYLIADGKPILFDANRTPSLGQVSREAYRPRAEILAAGIEGFI